MASEGKKNVHWWVRAEVKDGEGRTALTPENVGQLIGLGHRVTVERSGVRCFGDAAYAQVGAELEEAGAWQNKAPAEALVIGLKELAVDPSDPSQGFALVHRHIYFAHCYKGQHGWEQLLRRFGKGGGSLDDLEFLVDDSNRRVAAFGKPAGLVGAGLAILQFATKDIGLHLKPWPSQGHMVADLREALARLPEPPVVCIIGALGRVGSGALETCRQAGIPEENLVLWDMAETAAGGPFDGLLRDVDILCNCVYLTQKIPPFIDDEAIARVGAGRRLSVVSDISCDFTSNNHPLPFFRQGTDIHHPIHLTSHQPPIAV
ncbi:MAG: saccharopine dehydrogenase, partial [archaeon]|nr:saccharopine dehydrogenase [archaeon]